MTCPDCGYDESEGARCDRCGCAFVFTAEDGISDDRFLALVSEASGGDNWFFVRNQLYAAYARGFTAVARAARVGVVELGIGAAPSVLAAAIAVGISRTAGPIAYAALIPGLILSAVFLGSMRRSAEFQPPSPTLVYDWLAKWERARGELARLIRRRTLEKSPEGYPARRLVQSGIDRVLIVQQAILVDLMVKNDFPVAHRALVVAENGYPAHLAPTLERVLDDHPALPVFLVHDSTDEGVAMPGRVAGAARFPLSTHPVIDAGITPAQVSRLTPLAGLGLKARAYAIPLDMLPYPLIERGLVRAMRAHSSQSPAATPGDVVAASASFVEDGAL